MVSCRWLAWLAAAIVLASPLPAQSAGSLELGGFGRSSHFDKTLQLDDAVGGGGRVGVYLSRIFSIEYDAATTNADGPVGTKVTARPFHLRLNAGIPIVGSLALLLGAGYGRTVYGGDADASDDGLAGLAGFRLGVSRSLALRIDGTADRVGNPSNGASSNVNYGVQAGLSLLLGGATRAGDADRDGVADAQDACPDTPSRTEVDLHGCPIPRDRDSDGVMDPSDACPDTPIGARVDPRGCPLPNDTDRDGVIDPTDACPDTPLGAPVDASGCPIPVDTDGDGVLDPLDRCPGTAAGTTVDANGCPVPLDSDGDGVIDTLDACPGTPAGTTVDSRGCPLPADSDKDGVLDTFDRCPGTPPGTTVDAAGCTVLFKAGTVSVILQGVNFQTGKSALTPGAREVLDRVAASLVANPEVRVEVAGYTDSQGRRTGNIRLSQARAEAVRFYLMQRGVKSERIVARGYGPDNPIASNTTASGRAQNRRVELHRLP